MGILDLDKLLELPISDIYPAYNGVRGRTMSSQNQFLWQQIKEAGVKMIIDLREGGSDTHIVDKCNQYCLDYFNYPIDNNIDAIRRMIQLFPEFCQRIDNGGFYISCAMGLHRTDIALCCYWMFYGADNGIEPPVIRGYRKEDGHNTSKIMRVMNAVYKEFEHVNGNTLFPLEILKERKRVIEQQCREPKPAISE